MRRIVFLATAALLLGGAPGLLAQEELVGKVAGDFEAGEMLYASEVLAKSLEECRGDVILIKYWGLKCGPCKAAMPGIQRLWDENKDKGLHIFHVESQNHTQEEIQAYCEKMGYDFPQTLRAGGTDFNNFPGGRGLPYGFLIGVDGKVVWQGRRDYESAIAEQIAKVRYSGLGKSEVSKELKKSAKQFAVKKYGSAVKQAQKILDAAAEEGSDPALVEEAEYIIQRAHRVGETMKSAAAAAIEDREYTRGMEALSRIARLFKGFPIAEEATERLGTLKKDPGVKKERKAEKGLEVLMAHVKKAPTKEKQAQLLRAFAKKFDGTKASEKALRRAENL